MITHDGFVRLYLASGIYWIPHSEVPRLHLPSSLVVGDFIGSDESLSYIEETFMSAMSMLRI